LSQRKIPTGRDRFSLWVGITNMKLSRLITSRLIASLVASSLTTLAMAAGVPSDSALLITQLDSQHWQLRLIQGSSGQRFNGVVESSSPFATVGGLEPQGSDSVKLWSPTTLGANLTSGPGGVDHLNFSVGTDAQLCLRDTGSSGIQMYRGEQLQGALPVSAPVALSGAEACGDAISSATNVGNRKYHPGHYIALLRGEDTQTIMAQSIKPGVVGFMKRYSWPALEPTPGKYQFAEIKSDLAWAHAHGVRIIIMIEDKTFVKELPTPPDLDAYTARNKGGGYTVIRWAPQIETRFNALISAIGKQFDSSPALEGLATQETAPGFGYKVEKSFGYTPEKYETMYINLLTIASKSFPTSRIFWFMNFFPVDESDIATIASKVAPLGVFMGGPDVEPDNPKLENKVYPFYTQFQSKMMLFAQVEGTCYDQVHVNHGFPTKFWTMPELFSFAKTKLHVHYMFWVHLPNPPVPGAYDWLDALPVIAANPVINP
jgi:hypothetical protein